MRRQSSIAFRDASSMCRTRTSSPWTGILNRGVGQDVVAEEAAQGSWRVQIDLAPEHRGQLVLQLEERESRSLPGLELDEDVDVALRPEVLAENGPEQRELADRVALAEVRDPSLVDAKAGVHANAWYR